MRLTKNSQELLSFFMNNEKTCIQSTLKQTKNTKSILEELYHEMMEANKYLINMKKNGDLFHEVKVQRISSVSQIIKPKSFNANSFPDGIIRHIDETSLTSLSYTFSLLKRKVDIHFILEDPNEKVMIEKYNRYVDSIILWLFILNEHASKECVNALTVYLYFTSLEKQLPNSNLDILDRAHINTAFTTSCPKDSEIVLFREEEWFKVFIHETFHNFGLDFSDMNTDYCNEQMLSIFKVEVEDVRLYEAYCEFWAELMNALFCSYYALKDKKDLKTFLKYSSYFINFERNYSFFQLVKALHFMNLNYTNLFSPSSKDQMLRSTLYKERTCVLSYYIIKTVLLNNYEGFLLFCHQNNISLLQFKKTSKNLDNFCHFIKSHYDSKSMLQNVQSAEECYHDIRKKKNKINNKKIHYLLTNMRMSICELG